MGLKFKNNKLIVINYDELSLTEDDIDTMKKNYDIDNVEEISFTCKSFGKVDKPWYLQSVDWIKLIPENVIRNETYALKLPIYMPHEISIYLAVELYARTGVLPKILEYNEDDFNRIVDLEYEKNFSLNKKKENKKFKEDSHFNSEKYNVASTQRYINKKNVD